MNIKLENFKKEIKGKKVAVLGLGISNTPLIKYLAKMGVNITAFDRAEKEKMLPVLEQLKGLDIKYCLGENYLKELKGFDVIFKTPSIRADIPELLKERDNGAVITSEMELFFELCPAEIFAVTGSDGKTTTTTLVFNILRKHGYTCWLGGNIGTPLLDRIEDITETDKVILELSSFQLHTMKKSPNTAVITNISPNHLDVHKSMEEYIEAKMNIFKFQSPSDRVVLNYDNDITRQLSRYAKSNVLFFSRKERLENGAFLEKGKLMHINNGKVSEVVDVSSILLLGDHNIENYLAAICATADYVNPDDVRSVAATFKGVEHRMEFVREINNIKFYNDSIGTSPTRTIAGLKSFKQKVILIAGGYDKHIPYDEMGEILAEKVKHLVLIGPTGSKIADALKKHFEMSGKKNDIPITFCQSFDETVDVAYKNASPGDIVVLSPASASFDLFKNFEERGNRFKELVRRL